MGGLQLARHRGHRTVNVVRREEAATVVREAGGDVVLVGGEDLAKRVTAPIHATYDVTEIKEAAAAAASGGRSDKILIVPRGYWSGGPGPIPRATRQQRHRPRSTLMNCHGHRGGIGVGRLGAAAYKAQSPPSTSRRSSRTTEQQLRGKANRDSDGLRCHRCPLRSTAQRSGRKLPSIPGLSDRSPCPQKGQCDGS